MALMKYWISRIIPLLVLLQGCASYQEIVVSGRDKYNVLQELLLNEGGRDFAQLSYDAETKTEVFIPIDTLFLWADPKTPSEILVFENVTRPSTCVTSQRAHELEPRWGFYHWCFNELNRGDGQLREAFSLEELVARYNAGDASVRGVLAAAEAYYSVRDRYDPRWWGDQQQHQAWKALHHYKEVRAYYYYERCGETHPYLADVCWDDPIPETFGELDLADENFFPHWERRFNNARRRRQSNQYGSTSIEPQDRAASPSRVVTRGYPTKSTSRSPVQSTNPAVKSNLAGSSTGFSQAVGEFIGQAIGLWLLQEMGLAPTRPDYRTISEEDLEKIEAASRAGARRAARAQKVMDNLKTPAKIGCESYGC